MIQTCLSLAFFALLALCGTGSVPEKARCPNVAQCTILGQKRGNNSAEIERLGFPWPSGNIRGYKAKVKMSGLDFRSIQDLFVKRISLIPLGKEYCPIFSQISTLCVGCIEAISSSGHCS